MPESSDDFTVFGSTADTHSSLAEIRTGDVCRHVESQKLYTVEALLKIYSGDEWVDGVLYRNADGECYAQPLERFRRRFELALRTGGIPTKRFPLP